MRHYRVTQEHPGGAKFSMNVSGASKAKEIAEMIVIAAYQSAKEGTGASVVNALGMLKRVKTLDHGLTILVECPRFSLHVYRID